MGDAERDALAMVAGLAAARERAPAGVAIRAWREDADFGPMAEVRSSAAQADGHDFSVSPDQLRGDAEFYQLDPAVVTILAESGGRLVGWSRLVGPYLAPDVGVVVQHGGGVIPEARRTGIGGALVSGIHALGRERIAAFTAPPETPAVFQTYAGASSLASKALLEGVGYRPARWAFYMVRRSLEGIPECSIPPDVELRPVVGEDAALRVGRAASQAMIDHPGWFEETDDQRRAAMTHTLYGQMDVWQVAWAGDEPVAGVLGWIDESENARMGRLRGYTEYIWTLRPWRRRGLASALIAANLRLLRERGMTEAGLMVDTENPSGALHVYERMGFEVGSTEVLYRRPV
jgi:GNAT superfamily N-acetyltransferase